jgi:hypothetical protein
MKMTRTKTQIRGSKSKGSQFEYDVLHNLQRTQPNMYLTSKQGFVQQIDLLDDTTKFAVECKRHKSISWKQAKNWFEKLEGVAPEGYDCMLVFKANHLPVLCMVRHDNLILMFEFEDLYGEFEKHPPIRSKR